MSMQDDEVPPQMMGAPAGGMSGGLRMRARQVNSAEMDDEDDEGFVSQDVPTPQERRWSSWVAFMSGADMFMSLAILVVSWSFAYKDAGVSLWCMGLQALSHFLSSSMLAFRFVGEARSGLHADEAVATRLLRKERRRWLLREQGVAICTGLGMLLSSAGLLFKAFRKIRFWSVWYKDHDQMDAEAQRVLEFLAWWGFAVYFVQAVFRGVMVHRMRRAILWHGLVASLVSLVFLLCMGVAASYQKEWSWKAEPICAILLSFNTLAEGVRIVIMHLGDVEVRLHNDPWA
mmetsp:Transcript_78460/g.217978  ORF Transcript_78460/g.217978 Transcript_78460/m.217978 type:complete len:288 (-) Transcript_78460:311-1174(-)